MVWHLCLLTVPDLVLGFPSLQLGPSGLSSSRPPGAVRLPLVRPIHAVIIFVGINVDSPLLKREWYDPTDHHTMIASANPDFNYWVDLYAGICNLVIHKQSLRDLIR